MTDVLELPLWSSLVQALLHTLWQGAMISAVLFIALKFISARRVNLRYALAAGSLLVLVMCWLITWSVLERQLPEAPVAGIVPAAAGAEPGALPASGIARNARLLSHAQPLTSGETVSPSPAGRRTPKTTHWLSWAAVIWITGATLFQLRLLVSVLSARTLARQSRFLDDPEMMDKFARFITRLGLLRHVSLRVSESISVPSAWGLFKPVVLIPASYLSAVPPEQLEAVIAHELAHIRRHDVLVNLVQMVVEGLLFFNPFVWWISRQIRTEREGCCDVVAIALTGNPVVYVKALAGVAEAGPQQAVSTPDAAVAIGERQGELLDRVRRLLHPHGFPELRLPVRSVSGLLLLSLVSLALLRVTAASALELVSPAERIEHFSKLRENHSGPGFQTWIDRTPVHVSGRVRTHDGEQLPYGTTVTTHVRETGGSSGGYIRIDENGFFSGQVQSGTIHVWVTAEGYAPVMAGPFEATEDLGQLDLVLDEGFTGYIRFVDPAGNPVSAVEMRLLHEFPGGGGTYAFHISDSDGIVSIPHIGSLSLSLVADADSFQPASLSGVELEPGQVFDWKLQPSPPTSGLVVFEDTGEPVAGAKIYLGAAIAYRQYLGHLRPAVPLAIADENGRFQLNSLREDTEYYLHVLAPGASGVVTGPHWAEEKLRLEVPREQFLYFRVENVAEKHLDSDGELTLEYSVRLGYGNHVGTYTEYTEQTLSAVPEGGVAEFTVGPLWKIPEMWKPGNFSVGGRTLDFHWEEMAALSRKGPVEIDLNAEPGGEAAAKGEMRTVQLMFKPSGGEPSPRGAIGLRYPRPKDQQSNWERVAADVVEGRTQVDLHTNTPIEILPAPLVGSWFPPQTINVGRGTDPLKVEIEVFPAGSIHGEVSVDRGKSSRRVWVQVIPVGRAPALLPLDLGAVVIHKRSSTDEGPIEFMTTPLPFDESYYIVASSRSSFALSDPLPLTAATPFHQVTLALPQGADVRGAIARPDGQPFARGSVVFRFSPLPGHNFSETIRTDRDGRFVFEDVNPDVPGDYFVEVNPKAKFQPARKAVLPGQRIELQLEEGMVIEGTVLDAETGSSVPAVELYATRSTEDSGNFDEEWPSQFDAEGLTDRNGRFRFSNLSPGEYRIESRNGQIQAGLSVSERTECTWTAGSESPVVLEIIRGEPSSSVNFR